MMKYFGTSEVGEHPHCGWGRITLVLLAVPMMIMSCGTAPQGKKPALPSPAHFSSMTDPQASFHFLRGYLAELANEHSQALEEYHKSLDYDSSSVFLKTRIAKLYFSNGEMTAAVEMADQISPDQISRISDYMQLAKIYAGTGKPERALVLYDHAIQHDPRDAKTYISKGVLLLSLKRMAEAKQVFQDGLKEVSYSPEGHYYLALIEKESHHSAEAERHFLQAIEQRETFEGAYRGLATLYEEQDEDPKAIGIYQDFVESVNPHHKEFRLQLVRLHMRAKSYDQALHQLGRILEDSPNDLNAQVRKAFIYGEMGNYQKAADDLNTILQARPNELRVRDFLGLIYEEMKDYERARQAYKANLEIDPTYYDSVLHLGFLSYRLKKYEEAIPYLTQAMKLNPKRSESYLLLGLTYLQTEQYQLASARLEEGIQHDPTNADLHFNLGTAYDKMNRFDDLVREMERALSLDPKHADALNYLGYSYADRGVRIEQALELTQRAVALKPENGYYVDSLGWAQFKIGRLDEALQTLQHALSLVSDDPVIFEHLGEIYLKMEERAKAKDAWSHSIKLDSSNEKLIKRFREQGFGNPTQDEAARPVLPKVSHRSSIP